MANNPTNKSQSLYTPTITTNNTRYQSGIVGVGGTSTGTSGIIGVSGNANGIILSSNTIPAQSSMYTPLLVCGANGMEVLRVENSGEIVTLITNFKNLMRIRLTDHVLIPSSNETISLWDELYDKPRIKNTGRSLLLPDSKVGEAIELYLTHDKYADMSLGEFVERTAGLYRAKVLRKNRRKK